jgi:lipopolysaccharide/colanic/teichoic acid biosynthesis glycosyltransferase
MIGSKMKLKLAVKAILDFTLALIVLLVFSPVLVVCSLLILIMDGRPVLFTQNRPGLNNKIFKIYKFRTMKTQKYNENLDDHARMTAVGRFMRSTSLDELPQLFNVLKGELSLVGPRPLLVEYLALYNSEQQKRHNVKPGITGWAQINGRNAISWEEKFRYDTWYVENWSLTLDFKILFLTVFKIFKKSDVNASQNITMSKFKGSHETQ